MSDLERQIGLWTDHLRRAGSLGESDVAELESHLRDEIAGLIDTGLSDDEAFLIAVKRMGSAASVSGEFAKLATERLWKQLVLTPPEPEAAKANRREVLLVVVLCLIAGTLAKIPELFGTHMFGEDGLFYFKNLSLFVLPMVVAYFVWKRGMAGLRPLLLFVPFLAAAAAVNLYPFRPPGHTLILAGIHLPIALWLVVGVAYTGLRWSETARRMDFVRFSGEAFIYSVLILCGGVVLVGITTLIFLTIDVDIGSFSQEYLAVYGGLGSIVVAAYLVEAKKSVVENMAPVLARIFGPLFLVTMLSFLGAMTVLGKSPYTEREFLIGFDLLLALVLGVVLYTISARNPDESPGMFDVACLALIATALLVDTIALSAIVSRLSSFGFSPNKVAALGENVVLFVGLTGLAVHYTRFIARRADFRPLETWQMAYLPVYAGWAAVVAFVFPVVFGFK